MEPERCRSDTLDDWALLRHTLWPEEALEQLRAEAARLLREPDDRAVAFLVRDSAGAAVGFAEATLRRDYVNGCTTSPVAFLEGLYVRPESRRRGFARRLVGAVEAWAVSLGCTEFASDALVDNTISHRTHESLGFAETERVVYFRKWLGG